ncbi:MAG: ComEC/Rec2 family competence protein [Isosphaeraceae bacterium]|nr:ComEC/Rec2 family competence protein [Isosphaeraceae bacterium]
MITLPQAEPVDSVRPRRLIHEVPLLLPSLAFTAGVILDRTLPPPTWLVVGSIVLGVASAVRGGGRRRSAGILILFAAAGLLRHDWAFRAPGAGEFARPDRRPAWVRGVIVDDAVYRAGGEFPGHPGFTRTVLEVSARRVDSGWRPSRGRLLLSIIGDRSDLILGDRVETAGLLSEIEGPLNPGERDSRTDWRARGVWSKLLIELSEGVEPSDDPSIPDRPALRLLGRLRRWSRAQLTSGLPPSSVPLAEALLLGRRDAVDPDLVDAFARTGTTHLLAISGLHLQALGLALWWILRTVGVSQRRSLVGVMLVVTGYCVLVGPAPSVVRSLTMTILACLAGLRRREVDRVQVFVLAWLLTVAFDPANVFDTGCLLSFLAVGSIVWAAPRIVAAVEGRFLAGDALVEDMRFPVVLLHRLVLGPLRGVLEGLVVSLVVWSICWPLVAHRFHMSSPLGILLNLPLIPLTSLALFAAFATLVFTPISSALAAPFGALTTALLGWTEAIVRWGAERKWGAWFLAGPPEWWVVGFYLALGWVWWVDQSTGGRSLRALALLACWPLAWALATLPPNQGSSVHVLAVGHGLSVLVESGESAVLYDAGRMADSGVGRRIIAPALWALGVRRLDAIVISHADADHFNGVVEVIERIPTSVVRLTSDFDALGDTAARELIESIRAMGTPIEPMNEGDSIILSESTRLDAIHPPIGLLDGAADNERSLVLAGELGAGRFLLTGDLEGAGLRRLLETNPPAEPFEVVLAPHHGARAANPPSLFDWTRAEVVVASQKPPIGLALDFDRRSLPPSDVDVDDPLSSAIPPQTTLLRTWRRGMITIRRDRDHRVVETFLSSEGPERGRTPREEGVLMDLSRWVGFLTGLDRRLVIAVGLAIGFAAAFSLFVIEWGAWGLVRPRRRLARETVDGPAGIDLVITAADGARLAGTWYASPAPPWATIVLLHGLGEDRSSLRGRVEPFHERGWNAAILDARGFGESGGDSVAFGALEARDLGLWIDELARRFEPSTPLVVWGRSMGAAIALRASIEDPRIDALVLESPYADLASTLSRVLRRFRVPGSRIYAGLVLGRAARLAGVALHRPRPVDLARRSVAPVLMIHGSADRLVPVREARRLLDAFPERPVMLEIPGAGHADVFDVGAGEILDEVERLIRRVAGRGHTSVSSSD